MKKENKNLDEFFKEKLTSDKHAFLFSQHDWDILEQKLILGGKSHMRNVFLFKTLLGAAAALLMFFSIWLLMPDEPNSSKPQDVLVSEHKLPETSDSTVETGKQILQNKEETKVYENFNYTAQIFNNKLISDKLELSERSVIDGSVKTYTLNNATEPGSNSFSGIASKLPTAKYDHLTDQIEIPVVKSNMNIRPEMNNRKNIVLSVLIAPALNGVNGFKNGEIGGDLGFLVSIDVAKKLTVSTGAIYAKKLYEADFNRNLYPNFGGNDYAKANYSGGGYSGTSGYGDAKVFPESVYADCRVLDIPLNIDYSLIDKGKNKISIGTGLSSYIMLKEKYQFEYANQSNVDSESLELTNENRYIMGVLNFQAKYTRQLNSKMGISLQPYLKIPLRDIGYAKVKLQSVGMAVNINFNLSSNKK